MTTLTVTPRTSTRSASYAATTSRVMVTAFVLSIVHTVYSYVAGIGDPRFTVTTPIAYVFYALGFAAAALARTQARWAEITLAAYLTILLYVSVFYYPTTFVPRQQTVFGWFENDVYTGLLMIAAYLTVQRLRGLTLSPRGTSRV